MVSTTTEEEAAALLESKSNNPMLQQEGLPKFASIEPKHLAPAVSSLLSRMDGDLKRLEETLASAVQKKAVDYQQVLPEVERMQFPLGFVWGIASHLNGVKNSDLLRVAYQENLPRVVQCMTRFQQCKALYDALQEVATTNNHQDFVGQQRQRAVANTLRSMTLGGVGLEGEAKEKFNAMKMRLAELTTKFSDNVLDCTKAFSLTVTDAEKVKDVPASVKAMWAQSHAMAQETMPEEVDPDQGPWRITLDMPSYIGVMSHLPDRAIREEVYRASNTRASENDGDKSNVPIMNEIIRIRRDMAGMLGFESHAELSLSEKMAPSAKAVTELSDMILEKALPAAQKELAAMTALAQQRGQQDKLEPWDMGYWSERLKEQKFNLTEEELRPYFALPNVLEGMFGLVHRLFGIRVEAADGQAEVWHPDVRFFHVLDGGKHVASFYLDPYSRPENKNGGAWMDVCVGRSEAVQRDVPVAYLTCNGSPPVGDDTPSLMTFGEVETLFHEFGHGLQHMLTRVAVGDVAGINGVEWDAVELPSQFMENWCYDRDTVYGFAKHYQTGELLPEDKFEKLKAQKTFHAGMAACRQLYFGQMDMEIYSDTFDPDKETVFDVQRRVASKYVPHTMPLEGDRFLCHFSHIFAGGYSAGYYSYKWAEVMSADAFGAFEEAEGNEEAIRAVGKSFRDTVLALGGAVPPMQVFEAFRGRPPSPEPLLRHNGLL